MMMEKIAAPLDAALLSRLECLPTTAEYLDCLATIARDTANGLGRHIGSILPAAGDMPEWRQIETVLNLLLDQVAIVTALANDVDLALIGKRTAAMPRAAA